MSPEAWALWVIAAVYATQYVEKITRPGRDLVRALQNEWLRKQREKLERTKSHE